MEALSSQSTIQQISESYDSRIVLSEGYHRLYDALHLLQTDPAIKVSSLSLLPFLTNTIPEFGYKKRTNENSVIHIV